MAKKDLINIFIDETNSKARMRIYKTNKIIYSQIYEIWSIDLADMIDYKISNNKGFRYIFVIIDNFSKNLWCVPLINKNYKTVTDIFSIILKTSKDLLLN